MEASAPSNIPPLPHETQVLVVGAGPVGMAAAVALAQNGLKVLIVEASTESHVGTRAALVHSHTLEKLATVGLAEPIVDLGIKAKRITYYGTTNRLVDFDLSLLRDETKYPYSLLIPQYEVERVIREKLASMGVDLYRNRIAIGMRDCQDGPGMEVTFEDGSVVRAQYVFGADGARSTIRRLSEIGFSDPQTGISYEDTLSAFYLVFGDVRLEDPLPDGLRRDTMLGYLDDFLLLVPFRSNLHKSGFIYRMVCMIPNTADVPKHPTIEYFQMLMNARNPWGRREDNPIIISSLSDSSRYEVRSGVASTLFKQFSSTCGAGYVLLVGDAAHCQSPAGGQGMNMGIVDAISAAHAVHAHSLEKGSGDGDLGDDKEEGLRQWAEGRRERAIRVINFTARMNRLVQANRGWRRIIRNFFCSILVRIPMIRKQAARRLSGLANRLD